MQPFNGILIEQPQVACAVIANEQTDDLLLLFVLGHRLRFLKPKDNLPDSFTIKAVLLPSEFFQFPLLLHQL